MSLSRVLQIFFGILTLGWTALAQTQPARSRQGTLKFSYSTNITRVTIDHPPINLYDRALASDFVEFLVSIQPSRTRTPPKVVIFDSADPEFFIPHIDLATVVLPLAPDAQTYFAQVRDAAGFLRNTTTSVFIAEVDGRVSGFGGEIVLQTDLRFAGPNARASQLETSLAAYPGAGGMQALPRLINRGRALQYILSGDAVDGPTGTRLGWFNDNFGSKKDLRAAVDKLARRIALNPAGGLSAAKAAIPELYPPAEVYARDTDLFFAEIVKPESQRLLKKAIELGNNQTRSQFELDIPYSLVELLQ